MIMANTPMDDDRHAPQTLPHVRRLVGLARTNGVDVRETLLRVMVDTFILDERHSPAEIARFGELVSRLLDRASLTDRIIVAEKLARHPLTPTVVARRLALDVSAVAAPVLANSPSLTEADLVLAVRLGEPEKRLAVARRLNLPPAVRGALDILGDDAIRAALTDRLAGEAEIEAPALEPATWRAAGPSFLDADPATRLAIIDRAAASTFDTVEDVLALRAGEPDAGRSVELAALSRRESVLAGALATALDLPLVTASRIATDKTGEALVVAARALDMGEGAAARLLIFSYGTGARSLEALRELSDLYRRMPLSAALAIARSWRSENASPRRPARHASVLTSDSSDFTGARQAASPAARAIVRPAIPGRQTEPGKAKG